MLELGVSEHLQQSSKMAILTWSMMMLHWKILEEVGVPSGNLTWLLKITVLNGQISYK